MVALDETKNFEREVLERLIKIETKLESWDSSKAQIYENQRNILTLKEQNKQQETEIAEMTMKEIFLFFHLESIFIPTNSSEKY